SEEQLQKMFSTIVNIAQKVENLETAFSELSREATTIPGRAPETNTFKLI
ncbi:capsid protein, partial [Escherichia coli]|nr:capsid protein [Escherichia coli]